MNASNFEALVCSKNNKNKKKKRCRKLELQTFKLYKINNAYIAVLLFSCICIYIGVHKEKQKKIIYFSKDRAQVPMSVCNKSYKKHTKMYSNDVYSLFIIIKNQSFIVINELAQLHELAKL